jgi:transcriptional regulator with XRE-family HTH domain
MKPVNPSTSSVSAPIKIGIMELNLKKQLRFFLDRREMSAAQLARKAGVPKQSLSGWLGGSKPRDVLQVKKCAEVLGTTLDHLMFGEGENREQEKHTELNALFGDEWISGLFEVRLRRVKR